MYAWIAGASAKLTESKALILRSLLNSTLICVLSEIIAIIFDTGANTSLTPFLLDFKGKITPCFVKLQGISSGLIAKGKGTAEYNVAGIDGRNVTIEASAYCVPDLRFRIISLQSYFKHNKNAEFRINHTHGRILCSKWCVNQTFVQHREPPICTCHYCRNRGRDCKIGANVSGSEENTNLTRKGQLLLLWHQWLGHASFRLVHWLSKQGYLYGGTAVTTPRSTKHAATSSSSPHTSNTATHTLHHCPKQTSHQQQRVKLASPCQPIR